jgi:hypothetical protein
MPSYPAIYAPAIAIAHLVAFVLGLYSLEKSLGLTTKLIRRLGVHWRRHKREDSHIADLDQDGTTTQPVPAGREVAGHPGKAGVQSQHSGDCDSSWEAGGLTTLTSIPPAHKRAPCWQRTHGGEEVRAVCGSKR